MFFLVRAFHFHEHGVVEEESANEPAAITITTITMIMPTLTTTHDTRTAITTMPRRCSNNRSAGSV